MLIKATEFCAAVAAGSTVIGRDVRARNATNHSSVCTMEDRVSRKVVALTKLAVADQRASRTATFPCNRIMFLLLPLLFRTYRPQHLLQALTRDKNVCSQDRKALITIDNNWRERRLMT